MFEYLNAMAHAGVSRCILKLFSSSFCISACSNPLLHSADSALYHQTGWIPFAKIDRPTWDVSGQMNSDTWHGSIWVCLRLRVPVPDPVFIPHEHHVQSFMVSNGWRLTSQEPLYSWCYSISKSMYKLWFPNVFSRDLPFNQIWGSCNMMQYERFLK